jgi:hypothetical protein
VGRGGQILELLAGEDVDGDKMDLGVTVLAGLGGGHVDNLARAALDNDVTVLPQGRALHGEGGGGTGLATGLGIEIVLEIIKSAMAQGLGLWDSRRASQNHRGGKMAPVK